MNSQALKRFQIINLIIFSSVLVYFNFTIDLNFGDDVWAGQQALNIDSIIGLYSNWSGRVIAFIFQIFLIHNPVIFRILNSIIMIGMPIAIWCLLDRNKKLGNLTLIVLLAMLYDYKEMRTAGILTTYVTYFWSLFFNIMFYLAVSHYLKSGRILSVSLAVAIVTGIIACNSELGALLNTIIFFIILFVSYRSYKKLCIRIVFLTLIPFLSILYFFTCPGLPIRSAAETVTWLPEFSSYTLPHKVYLGFAETLLYYFSGKTVILMIFCGALLASAIKKRLPLPYLIIGFFSLIGFVIDHHQVGGGKLIVSFSNIPHKSAYFFLTFLLCFCCFVIMLLHKLFEDNLKTFILVIAILLLGFATRGVMGFSPTLYASNTRTFMYCDFAILAATYYIIKYSITNFAKLSPVILTFIAFIGAYPYFIGNLFP